MVGKYSREPSDYTKSSYNSSDSEENPNAYDLEIKDTPGELEQKPKAIDHTDDIVLNQIRTNIMIHSKDEITKTLTGWRIKNGEGKVDFEEYDFVSDLGEGSFSSNKKVYNKRLDKYFAMKIYKVKE